MILTLVIAVVGYSTLAVLLVGLVLEVLGGGFRALRRGWGLLLGAGLLADGIATAIGAAMWAAGLIGLFIIVGWAILALD